MSDKIEFLPCPFCGGTDISASDVGEDESNWFVGCMSNDCDVNPCVFHPDSEADAIAAWNRRASPPADSGGVTQELVADLVRECERAMKQRDAALADPTKRGFDWRTHDTTFEHILRVHLDPTYSSLRTALKGEPK